MLVQQLSLALPQLVVPAPAVAQLGAVVVVPVQAPAAQLPVAQGQGAPHCPFAVHVAIPPSSQVWAFGTHPPSLGAESGWLLPSVLTSGPSVATSGAPIASATLASGALPSAPPPSPPGSLLAPASSSRA
jgi:hypothetical protein